MLGLALQLLDRRPLIDVLGSMLYVVFFGLLIVLAWPRSRRSPSPSIALAIAVGVELLQLTPIPAAVVDAVPASRLLFGSAFDPMDLAAYLGGRAPSHCSCCCACVRRVYAPCGGCASRSTRSAR